MDFLVFSLFDRITRTNDKGEINLKADIKYKL